jgi:hypothetical protein
MTNELLQYINDLDADIWKPMFPHAIVEIKGEFHHLPIYDGCGGNIIRHLAGLLDDLTYLCVVHPDGRILYEDL